MDDVRMDSSLASGMLLQYLTTCIACLVLAFVFLVPYFSHPIRCPHPHVRSSPLPDFRQPSFIGRMRSNWRISHISISTVKVFNAISYETSGATQSSIRVDFGKRYVYIIGYYKKRSNLGVYISINFENSSF